MPKFQITSPDGKTFEITAPDGATQDQVLAYAQSQFKAKPTLADQEAQARKQYTPVGSDGGNFLAGIGKGLTDVYQGAKQLGGFFSPTQRLVNEVEGLQGQIDEAKKLDAPLMHTKAGLGGAIVGNIAPAVLAAPVAGAGIAGGAATGAALGAAQPVASDDSRLTNTAIGAVGGGVAPIIGRGISAGYGAIKGAIEPFTEAGRQAIAGRTLERFGVNAADVAGLSGSPTSTGARLTLAEQIARPEGAAGAARLQDAVRALDPEVAGRMTAREVENNAARLESLRSMAGDGSSRATAAAVRASTTEPLYQKATAATYQVDDALAELLQRPAVKQAMGRAETLAANQGRSSSFADGKVTGQGLQDLKMALDEMLTDPSSGFSGQAGKTIKDIRSQIVGWMEKANPDFKAARTQYAELSRPLNQQDAVQELIRRGTSATSDLAGEPRLMPNALMKAVQNGEEVVKAGTGRKGLGDLSDVLDANQLAAVRAVASEVDKGAAVARAGNGPGSGTAQRMASSNLLRQIGLPENMVDNALVQTLMRPVQWGANIAEPRIQQVLANIIQDPSLAAQALASASPAQRIALERIISNPFLAQTVRSSAPAAAVQGR